MEGRLPRKALPYAWVKLLSLSGTTGDCPVGDTQVAAEPPHSEVIMRLLVGLQ
jgi:hypothetical protein